MKPSLRFLLFILFAWMFGPGQIQAQIGLNPPAGVSPTQDVEVYTRNGFLVQKKYQYTSADPNASVNNLSCVSNAPSLTAQAGILKDPTGDATYTAGVSYSCTQAINLSVSVIGIEFVFEDLDTEQYYDYVSIIDDTGNEYRFSGNTLPSRLVVSDNQATIKFVTNANANVGRGFRLRWRALLPETITAPTPIGFGTVMQFDMNNSSFKAGSNNTTSGAYSMALGSNNVSSSFSSVALGSNNTASGFGSTTSGSTNVASGAYSVALGAYNTASGPYSVALGSNVTASGRFSTALGVNVNTNNKQGSFSIGDSDPLLQGVTYSGLTDQFVARFLNGYFLLTSGDVNPGGGTYGTVRTGVIISRGQNSWGSISDSTKKERFLAIDPVRLLRKIGAMKLTTWNYKGQPLIRHYGPMAQDFYAAFGQDGLGQIGCDTLIYSHDFAGVTFAGVQALIRENEQLKHRLAALEAEKQRTDVRLNELRELEARLEALERRGLPPTNPVWPTTQSDGVSKSKLSSRAPSR